HAPDRAPLSRRLQRILSLIPPPNSYIIATHTRLHEPSRSTHRRPGPAGPAVVRRVRRESSRGLSGRSPNLRSQGHAGGMPPAVRPPPRSRLDRAIPLRPPAPARGGTGRETPWPRGRRDDGSRDDLFGGKGGLPTPSAMPTRGVNMFTGDSPTGSPPAAKPHAVPRPSRVHGRGRPLSHLPTPDPPGLPQLRPASLRRPPGGQRVRRISRGP